MRNITRINKYRDHRRGRLLISPRKVSLWTHLKRDESLELWKRSALRSHLGDSLIPGLASESSCNQPRLQQLKKNLAMPLKYTERPAFAPPSRSMFCGTSPMA